MGCGFWSVGGMFGVRCWGTELAFFFQGAWRRRNGLLVSLAYCLLGVRKANRQLMPIPAISRSSAYGIVPLSFYLRGQVIKVGRGHSDKCVRRLVCPIGAFGSQGT